MTQTRSIVYASLFTALIVVGAYIKVPLGPVPFVLANFFVILAGAFLGFPWALASVGLYLVLGAIGIPVFSSGGGLAYFLGPTGGYLVGYLPAAAAVGLLSAGRKNIPWRDASGLVLGALAIYAVGVPWLKVAAGLSWSAAIAAGMTPFLVGDAIKIVAAFTLVTVIRLTYPDLIPRPDPGT